MDTIFLRNRILMLMLKARSDPHVRFYANQHALQFAATSVSVLCCVCLGTAARTTVDHDLMRGLATAESWFVSDLPLSLGEFYISLCHGGQIPE